MKRIVTLLLSLAMLFTVAACGDKGGDVIDTSGALTLTLWTPITGADGTVFNRLITKFNQAHEGQIKVENKSEVRDTHYNNIKNNVPDNGPDMAIIHSQLVMNYAENGYIIPLDDSFFTETSINTDDYLEKVMDTLYMDEKLYGVPLDVHPIVMYYNKSIVGDNPLPTDFSSLMALAQKLTAGDVWGLPISTLWPSEFVYSTALYQNGGQEITTESEPLFNSDAGAQAALNLHDIIYKYHVSPENLSADQDLNMFTTGSAAFHIQGCWSLSSLVDALGENLGAMPLSGLLTDNTDAASEHVMARSHVFTVTTPRRKLSDRKKNAIATFIKWMGENSAEWSLAGQIPAYNPARETDTFKNAPYLSDFGDPANFRTPAPAVYFESGFETVFEYVTTIMKTKDIDLNGVKEILAKAEDAAKRAVNTEKNG